MPPQKTVPTEYAEISNSVSLVIHIEPHLQGPSRPEIIVRRHPVETTHLSPQTPVTEGADSAPAAPEM
jgi:hypothetical protein